MQYQARRLRLPQTLYSYSLAAFVKSFVNNRNSRGLSPPVSTLGCARQVESGMLAAILSETISSAWETKMTVVRNRNIRKYLLSGLVILMATSTFAASNLYNFTLPNIDGKPMPLADFKGKVILMVNVASQCGFTPQYSALEAVYEKYKDQGFVILGFPANNFGQQEPGTNEEIKTFCSRKYSVTFPLVLEDLGQGSGSGATVSVSDQRRGPFSYRGHQVELHQVPG